MDSHCIVLEMCLQFEICPSKNVFNPPPPKRSWWSVLNKQVEWSIRGDQFAKVLLYCIKNLDFLNKMRGKAIG